MDEDEETGVALVVDLLSFLCDFDVFRSEEEDDVGGLDNAEESMPAKEGKLRLAKLANSEFVRFIFPSPRALIFGIPPKGSNK